MGVTKDLKGLAILAVIFSHFGYFLASDHRFLYPLSIIAGVGVNLFLFLSGYGLVASSLKKKFGRLGESWRRLLKLFIPLWIILIVYFLLDYFFLDISYPAVYVIRSFFGLFLRADVFSDLNSPLWYFTLILFYYLAFHLVFIKKAPWLSALIIYWVSYWLLGGEAGYLKESEYLKDIIHLYKLHLLAFPLGMVFGNIYSSGLKNKLVNFYQPFIGYSGKLAFLKKTLYFLFIALLLFVAAYTAVHSGVGEGPEVEERRSLITMAAIVILFIISRYQSKLFTIFGLYSYEIYLLHWPLASRYDIFFKMVPAWLAVILYLVLFLALAWILQKISKLLYDKLKLA